jgi:hypothetical protein
MANVIFVVLGAVSALLGLIAAVSGVIPVGEGVVLTSMFRVAAGYGTVGVCAILLLTLPKWVWVTNAAGLCLSTVVLFREALIPASMVADKYHLAVHPAAFLSLFCLFTVIQGVAALREEAALRNRGNRLFSRLGQL